MERIERRRFWAELLLAAPVALAACVALWALSPVLTRAAIEWLGPFSQGALLPALAIILTLAALAFAGREPIRA
jgi:hypothetical protein